MTETKDFPARHSGGTEQTSGGKPEFDGEIQFRIGCRSKSSEEVLEELAHSLAQAAAEGRDPLIVLEDLGLLGDSITTLMKGISRRLVGYRRTVTFWERSGYTEAFLSAMEGPKE